MAKKRYDLTIIAGPRPTSSLLDSLCTRTAKQGYRLSVTVVLLVMAVGGSGCADMDRPMRREYDDTLSLERKAQILRDEQRLRKGLPLEP